MRLILGPHGRWLSLALLFALLLFTLSRASAQDSNPAKAEAELKAVRTQIDKVRAEMQRDAGRRDKLTREIEESEKTVGAARDALEKLRRERAEHTARRAELAAERAREEAELARDRGALAGQIRAAHMIGQQEPIKLLLNQRDPGRPAACWSTTSTSDARAPARSPPSTRISPGSPSSTRSSRCRRSGSPRSRSSNRESSSRLQSARERRGRALVSLEAESKNRARELERLKEQQGGLEKLVRELRRALERIDKFPTDSKDAFAKLRGKLAWPVAGKLVAAYGQTRAGGVKWDGMLVTGAQGAPVRAVYHGRVVYADWLSGLGLLTIIDHGDGYLSLYGHNERLYKEVGERVTAGDTIATLGDSGGRPRPELYFEIRKAGRPVDPRPVVQIRAP